MNTDRLGNCTHEHKSDTDRWEKQTTSRRMPTSKPIQGAEPGERREPLAGITSRTARHRDTRAKPGERREPLQLAPPARNIDISADLTGPRRHLVARRSTRRNTCGARRENTSMHTGWHDEVTRGARAEHLTWSPPPHSQCPARHPATAARQPSAIAAGSFTWGRVAARGCGAAITGPSRAG